MKAFHKTPGSHPVHSTPPGTGTFSSRAITLVAILVTTAVILVMLELGARQVVPSGTPLERARAVITAEGLPALADLFEPDPERFWKLRSSLRQYRVQGTIEGYPIDFTVSTDNKGRRVTPMSDDPGAPVVWTLGDSATFGLGVDDDQAWPARLALMALDQQQPLNVFNYGVPGYTAWQGLQQLRQLLETDSPPDFLVAGFWANDKATWTGRSDVETARLLARAGSPMAWINRLALLKLWAERSPVRHATGNARPRLSEQEFTDCLGQIIHLCRQYHVHVALLVWPSRPQVEERQRDLYGYQRLVENTALEEGCSLINPAQRFIAAGKNCFVDNFHGNAEGCRLAAEEAWAWLSTNLEK